MSIDSTKDNAATQPTPNMDSSPDNERFQTGAVGSIAVGHFAHDTFGSAFLPAIFPILQAKLALSYGQMGWLGFALSIPSLINPLIGYLADRGGIRLLLILAPAITATMISAIGLVNNYVTVLFMVFCAGLSVAVWHAPAPALVGAISGKRVGLGMSIFMLGGEISRALGPLVAAAGFTWFGFEGMWRLSIIAWLTSLFLFFQLRKIKLKARKPGDASVRDFLQKGWPFFSILGLFLITRLPMNSAMTIYLPTYVTDVVDTTLWLQNETLASVMNLIEGWMGRSINKPLWLAASALTILESAGVIGIAFSGTVSDFLGRIPVLVLVLAISPFMFLGFLYGPAAFAIIFLILLGLTAIAPMPVLMALVQDTFPENRALANGVFTATNFVLRGVGLWLVGWIADRDGLQTAFFFSGLLALLSAPIIWYLTKIKIVVEANS